MSRPAPDEKRQPGIIVRLIQGRFSGSPMLLWVSSLLLLLGACLWVFFDPAMHEVLAGEEFQFGVRMYILFGVAALGAVQCVWLLVGTFTGSRQFRAIQAMAVLVVLISLWLGSALNLPGIAWQGRRFYLLPRVEAIKPIAQPLIQQWPAEDGEVETIGPFMAYPVGRPTTLILLTPPQLTQGGPSIAAVERSAAGDIRFELTDAGGNDWMEYRPHSPPDSHVGGLLEYRELVRSTPLYDNWYLVRYRDNNSPAPADAQVSLASNAAGKQK